MDSAVGAAATATTVNEYQVLVTDRLATSLTFLLRIMLKHNLKDHGSNYNAFGYDPDGWVAYLAALFYGPDWVPQITPKQFGGPPAPPCFSPPAQYQKGCLPPGFKARMH
jgi:hypothetical protein